MNELQKVEIVDINMTFLSMVVFMIKWAFASIPAFIIICALVAMCVRILTSLNELSTLTQVILR